MHFVWMFRLHLVSQSPPPGAKGRTLTRTNDGIAEIEESLVPVFPADLHVFRTRPHCPLLPSGLLTQCHHTHQACLHKSGLKGE